MSSSFATVYPARLIYFLPWTSPHSKGIRPSPLAGIDHKKYRIECTRLALPLSERASRDPLALPSGRADTLPPLALWVAPKRATISATKRSYPSSLHYLLLLFENLNPRNLRELVTTKMELKAMAPAAIMGLRSPVAAMGIPAVL